MLSHDNKATLGDSRWKIMPEGGVIVDDAEKLVAVQKKHNVVHIVFDFLVLIFSAVGLGLTLSRYDGDRTRNWVLGNHYAFTVAFGVSFAISGSNMIVTILFGFIKSIPHNNPCNSLAENGVYAMKSALHGLGCVTSFALMIVALKTSANPPKTEEGLISCSALGCSNVIAVIVAVLLGLRILFIICAISCFSCCDFLCLCSDCCLKKPHRRHHHRQKRRINHHSVV